MTDSPVRFSSGLPETVLAPEPAEASAALAQALAGSEAARREQIAAVVARWPRFLDAWARLGASSEGPDTADHVIAYACYRVGYHRGLDALRQAGWRGSGYVRWEHEENRGFLRSLDGLRRCAAAIGEEQEADRCAEFIRQLDPTWDGRELR